MKPKNNSGRDRHLKDIKRSEYFEKRQFWEELGLRFIQFCTIFDALKAVIYVADMQTYQLLFVNKYGLELFGSNCVGKRCFEVLQNGQSEPCSFCTNKLLVKDDLPQPPYIWEHYNELLQKWVKCIDTAIRWDDGRLVRMEIAINISEQKLVETEFKQYQEQLEKLVKVRTEEFIHSHEQLKREINKRLEIEESLRQSEERYRQLVEHSPNLIAVHIEDKIAFINKPGADLLGAKCPEEIIGKSIWDFVYPNSQENTIERIKNALSDPTNVVPASREKIVRLDGSVIYMEIFGYPITYQSRPAMKVVARDITEQKWLKKEMTRLERLNLIGQMAAGIGHEIRNPMTTIRGFLQLLSSKNESIQFKEYYQLMISELDRMNLLITEFLSLAKDKPSQLKRQNINSIIHTILPLIEADATNGNKKICHSLNDVPDLLIDEKELRQLIYNLCRNGLQAMSDGGVLTIKTFVDVNEVVLAIRDQGNGIDPYVLDNLGTPFITTKDDGTGLGLTICYSIAARHNAAINVETSPTGTTFEVRFKV